MVHDVADVPGGPRGLDSVGVQFNEERLIGDAGLVIAATLAERLGVEELVNESIWLLYRTPGAALPGRKVMTLVHGMLAGAGSIDDMNLLRAGSTAVIFGHRVMAALTLGTVPASVHLWARPPARPGSRRGARAGVGGRGESWRAAAGGGSGQLHRRGPWI